jgi:hypothetical protein
VLPATASFKMKNQHRNEISREIPIEWVLIAFHNKLHTELIYYATQLLLKLISEWREVQMLLILVIETVLGCSNQDVYRKDAYNLVLQNKAYTIYV